MSTRPKTARNAEVVRLYVEEHLTSPEIGRQFRISAVSVRAILKRAGITLRTCGGNRTTIEHLRAELEEAYRCLAWITREHQFPLEWNACGPDLAAVHKAARRFGITAPETVHANEKPRVQGHGAVQTISEGR